MNIDIKTKDFIESLNANTNESGYCKITLYKSKEGSASKNTHYGVLNEFVPQMKPKANTVDISSNDLDSELPF